MVYWIWLKDRKGNPFIFSESYLPGIIPQKQIEHTHSAFVRSKLKLCETCSGAVGHVIEAKTGEKYCPILFSDLFKTRWSPKDLL